MRIFLISLLFIVLGGCSAVTIQPQKMAKLSSKPTYQDSRPFFMWGLVGEQRVDVKKVCVRSKVAKELEYEKVNRVVHYCIYCRVSGVY